MNNVIEAANRFIKPVPQSKLNGQLGLTVQDIASSLGIEPKHVREKLTSRGMLDRIKACGFNAVAFATHSANGSDYTDFTLDVNAAKWFIAKYNNTIADDYLGYLVKVESDAVQSGQTFGHVDPTNITSLLNDPDFLIAMGQRMKDLQAERDHAIQTKAQISDKKTATAMATASAATRKLRLVEAQLGNAEDIKTVTGWVKEFPALLEQFGSDAKAGAKLSKFCKTNGFEVSRTPHQKWGTVNAYPREAVAAFLKSFGSR